MAFLKNGTGFQLVNQRKCLVNNEKTKQGTGKLVSGFTYLCALRQKQVLKINAYHHFSTTSHPQMAQNKAKVEKSNQASRVLAKKCGLSSDC